MLDSRKWQIKSPYVLSRTSTISSVCYLHGNKNNLFEL